MRISVKKKFDCLEMKRAVQQKAWAKVKGLSTEARLAYWQQRHAEMEMEKRAATVVLKK